MDKKRPFHETIVTAIRRCTGPSTGEILRLHRLIMETDIPKNHDAILEALHQYWDFPGSSKWRSEIADIIESVETQKQKKATSQP